MSGNSNVGTSGVYEAGDQRNVKNEDIEQADRYHVGNLKAHKANDSSPFANSGEEVSHMMAGTNIKA
jgi:hypothetical protein